MQVLDPSATGIIECDNLYVFYRRDVVSRRYARRLIMGKLLKVLVTDCLFRRCREKHIDNKIRRAVGDIDFVGKARQAVANQNRSRSAGEGSSWMKISTPWKRGICAVRCTCGEHGKSGYRSTKRGGGGVERRQGKSLLSPM